MFLNHIRKPSIYLPFCMMLWVAISCVTGQCLTFHCLAPFPTLVRRYHTQFYRSPPHLILPWFRRLPFALVLSSFYHSGTSAPSLGSAPHCWHAAFSSALAQLSDLALTPSYNRDAVRILQLSTRRCDPCAIRRSRRTTKIMLSTGRENHGYRTV